MAAARILYVDGSAGASGDMILGALVDLGVPLAAIRRAIGALPLRGLKVAARKVKRGGFSGRKVDVTVPRRSVERDWHDIRKILERGKLGASVRARALAVFRRLFEAEGRVHGVAPERVHLHEAGAADAIVDVVGACAAIEWLGPQRIVVSRLTTGYGSVHCEHGLLPVPAPATALLLRGVPSTGGTIEGERLTPTGAAILTTLADAWGPMPPLRTLAIGYGAGSREFPGAANLLRMVNGEVEEGHGASSPVPEIVAVEVTLDDASPQSVAYATERLFESGALEVYTTPVHMKKGRSGHQITILCREEDFAGVSETVFRETTTLGLRHRREGRMELDRRFDTVTTPYGPVTVKVGLLAGRPVQAWPEYEECVARARKFRVPLKEVQQAALAAHRTKRRARRTKR